MAFPLSVISEQIGAELTGDRDVLITGVSGLEQAEAGQITFAEHDSYAALVERSPASAVVVPKQFPAIQRRNLLHVANPRAAFVKIMYLFNRRPQPPRGIHPSAVVSPKATLGEDVCIGEAVVIRDGAKIGKGTVIESGVHVAENVTVGQGCWLGPNVVLMHETRIGDRVAIHPGTVVGGDGFGYVWADGRHVKIPQLGNVIIEDDVELGCNVCVDRATFGSTIIRRGTKMDNLVQIGHNDIIGEHVIMAGQVGLAGSVTVGNRAMFGGKAGVVDHITIGDDAKVGAATPVTKDVPAGETVWGFPGRPAAKTKRELASLARLPDALREIRALRQEVDALRARLGK